MATATDTKAPTGSASLRGAATDADRAAAGAAMGRLTSEKKKESSAKNGALAKPGPGLTPKPLEELACTCGAGMELSGHRWNCPRGQAIKRRKAAGTL